ncbi:MAG: putative Ig domain-containing protein, partial [Bacteroidota bacterium]
MRISTRWIGGLVLLFSSAFVMPAQAQDAPTDAPVLVSPVDQDSILVTEPEVALEWQVAAGAATHEVQLFYSEPVEGQEPIPLKTKVLNDASQSIEVADLLTFVTDAGSDGDSTFHWRVRGRNASGEGPWSDVWQFTLVEMDAGPPEVENPGPQTIDELVELSVPIEATSPGGSTLGYALDQASLDAGMTIDPDTGVLTWTPSEEQGPGSYDVTVTVTDEDGQSSSQTFTITVNEVNLPPVLDPIADQAAEVDVELTIDANATDPDIPANNLTYSLDQASLDAGMVIDPATGVITWTPTADQEMMTFPVTVTVTDDGDPVASD